jgi:hypothetical protein
VQVYDDSEEWRKVMSYYQLFTAPVILVLDPLTGQKRREWKGFVEHERLLEVGRSKPTTIFSMSRVCHNSISVKRTSSGTNTRHRHYRVRAGS